MTFAAPMFLWVSAAVALATVALHLLAWRRPPESPLPTARFAPERPVRMVSRAVRPADLALLALRVSIISLVGVALARPMLVPQRSGAARVVVVDRSRYGGDGGAVAAAARGVFRPGDALVVFDSAAREVTNATADSVSVPVSLASGSLSPALVQAVRSARRLQRERDSVEIVVVSPFANAEIDAATSAVRRLWAGSIRLVRAVPAPNDTMVAARPAIRASRGDPVAATLTLVGDVRGGGRVRIVRDAVTTPDSAWARDGNALVIWPAPVTPSTWMARSASDTAIGVTVFGGRGLGATDLGAATVVAPLVRTASPPAGDVIARWSDGEPAVTEATLGMGCIRSVAVPVPTAGDLPLTPAFRRFAARLLGPCTRAAPWVAASDSVLAATLPLTFTVSPDASTASVANGPVAPSRLAAGLLGLALLALLAETFVRRGTESNATA